MKKTVLTFRELKIHKAPGFSKGLPRIDKLAPNINIITGANASGKSTTARTIQSLIWPKEINNLYAEANLKTDGDWYIKLDHGNIVSQKEGKDEQLTNVPAAEDKRLYMLAIQDLIQKEEHDLAGEIMKEAIGGYDLDKAKNELGFEDKISRISTGEYQHYIQAEADFKKLKQTHEELKKREKELDTLYTKKNKAKHADKLKTWYTALANYLKAKQEAENQNQYLEQFPETLKDVTGKEVEETKDLETNIRETERIIEQTKNEVHHLKKSLDSLHLPKSGVSEETLTRLENYVNNLLENEKQIRETKTEIADIKTEEKESLKAINPELEPDGWEGIDLDDVTDLDQFLNEAHNVFGNEYIIRREAEMLEDEIKNNNAQQHDADTLKKGILALGQWLKTPVKTASHHTWLIPAMVIAAIITAVLCYLFGWTGLFGIIVVVGLPIVLKPGKQDQTAENHSLKTREEDYRQTSLEPPSSWNTEHVTEKLDALIDTLQDALFQEKFSERLKKLKQQHQELKDQIKDLQQQHKQLRDKLHAIPKLPDTIKSDFSSMYWFLINLKKWQNAHTKHASLQAKLKHLESYHDTILNKCNEIFTSLQFDNAGDAAEADSIFKKIKKEEEKRNHAEQQISDKNKTIEKENNRLNSHQNKYNTIFNRLNIDIGYMPSLQNLTNQKSEYDENSKETFAAQQRCKEKEQDMKNHSLFEEHKSDITSLTPDEIKDNIQEQQEISETWEEINNQIKEIEIEIKHKKAGHELEDLLSKKEKAARQLEDLYERNMAAITGNMVLEELKQSYQEKNQPEVLKRAGTTFSKITNGRYDLLIEGSIRNNTPPVFKAKDTVLDESLHLSELSTGTRVQLILAVRLAFIEHNESMISLPLLADELLANSDNARAKAIIETLTTISKEGRQVFYFTAQADEASKWKSILDNQSDITYEFIPIDKENTEIPAFPDINTSKTLDLTYNVPSPNGKNHSQYAKDINPVTFDLLCDTTKKLHLWYIIEDTELLYRCLNKGIQYWEQLQNFLNYKGQIEGLTDEIKQELRDKVTIIDAFIEAYRIGRSKPIDRSILIASDTISDKFIDKVDSLLKSLNGDPEKLISALKTRQVAWLQNKYIDALNDYLETEEYIDNAEPLPLNEIQNQMAAVISNIDITKALAERLINRVLFLQGSEAKDFTGYQHI